MIKSLLGGVYRSGLQAALNKSQNCVKSAVIFPSYLWGAFNERYVPITVCMQKENKAGY